MSKSRITWLFLISVIACIAGGILVTLGWFTYPDDTFVRNGSEIVGIVETPQAAMLVVIGIVGALVLAVAAIAGVTAWIGALLNTAALERKRWFVVLAVLGAFNCGLLGTFFYVIAGPAGTSRTVGSSPAIHAASAS